jgi:Protein of unknown function (DUF3761)
MDRVRKPAFSRHLLHWFRNRIDQTAAIMANSPYNLYAGGHHGIIGFLGAARPAATVLPGHRQWLPGRIRLGSAMKRSITILAAALAASFSRAALAAPPYDTCPYGTYQAHSGDCVPRPDYSPRNVTAICCDGTHSHSESHQGACSHHGGVCECER